VCPQMIASRSPAARGLAVVGEYFLGSCASWRYLCNLCTFLEEAGEKRR